MWHTLGTVLSNIFCVVVWGLYQCVVCFTKGALCTILALYLLTWLFSGRGGGRVDDGFLWVREAELGNKSCKVVIESRLIE